MANLASVWGTRETVCDAAAMALVDLNHLSATFTTTQAILTTTPNNITNMLEMLCYTT